MKAILIDATIYACRNAIISIFEIVLNFEPILEAKSYGAIVDLTAGGLHPGEARSYKEAYSDLIAHAETLDTKENCK